MDVVLAWFARDPRPAGHSVRAQARVEAALREFVPSTYRRLNSGGTDWGLTVLQMPERGAWQWPVVATTAEVTAVSFGVPVGIDVTSGPVALAQRLLRGEDIHAEVMPPFGMLALERDRRFCVQQDWLGMCRLFTAESDGVTVLSNRPSLIVEFLGLPAVPDMAAWASYAAAGHFGGDVSPIDGVRLLTPGERLSGQRRDSGGWDLTTHARFCVDDVVTAGVAGRGGELGDTLDLAADALTRIATTVDELYPDTITLGLSGGKDSRLTAAALIAGGRLPRFETNEDTLAEGETARELVRILRDKRGLTAEHRLTRAGAPAVVVNVGLLERVRRMQIQFDYQFSSTYTVRPAGSGMLSDSARPVSFTGAGGELVTGYWYPAQAEGGDRAAAVDTVVKRLTAASGAGGISESVLQGERARLEALLVRGEAAGLTGLDLVDYVYLLERVRRWYSSAYFPGMVTPFLSPNFVAASFTLTPEQKRGRVMHAGLMERFLPEWSAVPYVSVSTGRSTATQVWDGDGLEAIHGLLDTVDGRLTGLLRRDVVTKALVRAGRGEGTAVLQKTLQQFAYLAVAAHKLEPASVTPPISSYAEFRRSTRKLHRGAGVLPAPLTTLVGQLRFVKKTRMGEKVWTTVRTGVIRARARRVRR